MDSSGNMETEQLILAGAFLPGFQEEVSFRQSLRIRSAAYGQYGRTSFTGSQGDQGERGMKACLGYSAQTNTAVEDRSSKAISGGERKLV